MKRIFFTTIIVMAVAVVMAGEEMEMPLLQVGKVWNYDFKYVDINFQRHEGSAVVEVEKDTIIDGRQFFVITAHNTEGLDYTEIWQEEEGKVYICNDKGKHIDLVYDFTLSEGDKLPGSTESCLFFDGLYVLSVDSVQMHGLMRKRMVIGNLEGQEKVIWIEGIGNANYLSEPVTHLVSDGREYRMASCYLGDEMLCDAVAFSSDFSELMMLGSQPEWTYVRVLWDAAAGQERPGVQCRAFKSGYDYTSVDRASIKTPIDLFYARVTVEENAGYTLLLRQHDKVYVRRDTYREYMSGTLPETAEFFEELSDDGEDVVLYDFSLNPGDRYPCIGDVTVASVDEMTTRDGISRRLLRLSNGLEILEGVGCLNSRYGVFAYQSDPGVQEPAADGNAPAAQDDEQTSELSLFWKYEDKSHPVYMSANEQLGIRPAGTVQAASGKIYDLTGRQLDRLPQRGVYIRDGKKYVK